MGARVETFQAKDGSWRWHLQDGNNEIVAHGEGHTSERDAVRAAVNARDTFNVATFPETE